VAYTAIISRHGAMILCGADWKPPTVIEVQNQKTKESSRCRVVWSGGEDRPGVFKLGLEMLEAHPHFWAQDYPPDEQLDKPNP
jgi:hypothetical protein